MATKLAQTDVTPNSGPAGLNIHFHGPAGQSSAHINNPSDFPNATPGAASNSQGKAVKVSLQGTQGVVTRFSNPA